VKVMNWGYWGSIGIVASESYRRRMEQAGFGSIEPADAMAALDRLLSAPVHQMVFVKATHPNVINALDVSDREQVKVIAAAPAIRLKPRSKRADEPRRSEVMQPA
jgi:polyketide synthase PksM